MEITSWVTRKWIRWHANMKYPYLLGFARKRPLGDKMVSLSNQWQMSFHFICVLLLFMCFCREEWTTYFWEKYAMENYFQANQQKYATLQICCKTVNINVAWDEMLFGLKIILSSTVYWPYSSLKVPLRQILWQCTQLANFPLEK